MSDVRRIEIMPVFKRTLTDRISVAAAHDVGTILDALRGRSDLTDLHGVALCTISDATSVYWTAETISQRDCRIRDIFQHVKAADASCTLSFHDVLRMYQYEPADWPITDSSRGLPGLNELNDAIDEYWTQLETSPILRLSVSSSRAIRSVLSAIADGMLNAMSDPERNAIKWDETLALLWINDPDDPELVREFARRLNHHGLYEGFSDYYFNSN